MGSSWISFAFFAMAGVIHLGFFVLEAFLLQRPQARAWMKLSEESFAAVKLWALSQSVYNLSLAVGTFVGLSFVITRQVMLAGVLTGFCALTMIGAAAVLWWSAPALRRWAYIQGGPPVLGFVFLYFHVGRFI